MSRTDPRPNYGTYRRVRRDGYVDLWDPTHPLARSDGYVFEHRKVTHDAGHLVNADDHVHHINGDKQDNRLANLEVIDASSHQTHRHAGDGGWAKANHQKTRCTRGHLLAGENLVVSRLPSRVCRTCNNNRRRYAQGLPPKEVYA